MVPSLQTEIHQELSRRRSPVPFIPFAIITVDGVEHMVRRSGQFALRENDMMLLSNAATTRIRLADIARIEERRLMTKEQEKIRDDLVAHLNGKPFRRFSIRMTDGSSYEIVRVFQAAIGLTKGYLVSADGKNRRNFHIRDIATIEEMVAA